MKKEHQQLLDKLREGRLSLSEAMALSKANKTLMKHIASDARLAVNYAIYIVEGRWEQGEDVILKDKDCVLDYLNILNGCLLEAKPTTFKQAELLYQYALHIVQGRVDELEYIILDSPMIFDYTKNVVKGRWPEAEARLMFDVIKGFTSDILNDRTNIYGQSNDKKIIRLKGEWERGIHDYIKAIKPYDWPEGRKIAEMCSDVIIPF